MVNTALTENQPTNIETNYIHINLNHRPSVIKKIPRSIEKKTQFCHHQKIFFRSQPFTMKNA